MALPTILQKNPQFFIALQYHTLLLNRRLLVFMTEKELVVLKAGGLLSDQHPTSGLANLILIPLQVASGRMQALHYLQPKYVKRYAAFDELGRGIVEADPFNFAIPYAAIDEVQKVTKRKWGMGSVPYTGRLNVVTTNKTYEFILLGDQNLDEIHSKLLNRIDRSATIRS